MSKKTGLVVGLGLVVGVLTYFILSPLFQTDINRTVNSLVDKYQKAALIEETNYYEQTPIYQTQPINLSRRSHPDRGRERRCVCCRAVQ